MVYLHILVGGIVYSGINALLSAASRILLFLHQLGKLLWISYLKIKINKYIRGVKVI